MIKFYHELGHNLFKCVYLDILSLKLELIKHDNLMTEKHTEEWETPLACWDWFCSSVLVAH